MTTLPRVSSIEGEARTPTRQVGAQTLARGLLALFQVVEAPEGLTIQQVADALGVHRTIAYRILETLAEFRLIARSADGRYRPGAGLATLAHGFEPSLRDAAVPVMRELADQLGSTIALLVADPPDAVAIAVVEPTSTPYHLAFRSGSRHRLDRGSAGYALLAAGPHVPGEPAGATRARDRGYAASYGEVEPGAYGVAVPIRRPAPLPRACLNLITYRQDIAKNASRYIQAAAERISALLASQ
jgi:DNA-binding IclR family transcriptional regulator